MSAWETVLLLASVGAPLIVAAVLVNLLDKWPRRRRRVDRLR